MALTDTAIKSLKGAEKPKKHSDGGGLFLLVTVNGSKLWRLSYRFDGKQKTMALGAYAPDARGVATDGAALSTPGGVETIRVERI